LRRKANSVIKAFTLLKSFRDAEEWVSSSELSRRAGLPEASGYRLIQTLEEIGAVARGPKGRYRTGPLLLSLSHNVTLAELLREASQPLMTDRFFGVPTWLSPLAIRPAWRGRPRFPLLPASLLPAVAQQWQDCNVVGKMTMRHLSQDEKWWLAP
jgi:DNA-binding IscR family transcriptional regulator